MTDAYDLIIPEMDGFNHSVVVGGLLRFYAAPGKDDPVIAVGACADSAASRLVRCRSSVAAFVVSGGRLLFTQKSQAAVV